jgi:hypothetical protein
MSSQDREEDPHGESEHKIHNSEPNHDENSRGESGLIGTGSQNSTFQKTGGISGSKDEMLKTFMNAKKEREMKKLQML